MKFNPKTHHRQSVRLKGYDYTQPGWYFVTVCTHGKRFLFGDVSDGQMLRNGLGDVAQVEWFRSAKLRDDVLTDAFIVMPNHIHGVLARRGTARRAPTVERFGQPVVGSLPTLVRAYKAAVTRNVNLIRNTAGEAVWQRNYYEHVIRNDRDLNRVREYICRNPERWPWDRENPACDPDAADNLEDFLV
jgi:REP-associated tyrosine transposase